MASSPPPHLWRGFPASLSRALNLGLLNLRFDTLEAQILESALVFLDVCNNNVRVYMEQESLLITTSFRNF